MKNILEKMKSYRARGELGAEMERSHGPGCSAGAVLQ